MTEIDDDISGGMPIRPEDYEFFIRALWKSHQMKQRQIEEVLRNIQNLAQDTKETKAAVEEIKAIFSMSRKMASVIKWTSYVLVPIIGLAFGIYTFFHKGQSQ